MKVIFRSTRPLLSRRQYGLFMVLLWVYTFAWLCALIIINLLLPFGMIVKAALTLLLVLVTPTDGHFMSYEKYRRWHSEHVVVVSSDNSG